MTKRQIIFNSTEEVVMSQEIDKLLSVQVIHPITRDKVKYVSSIFLRPKQNGSYKLIFNLKNLNDYVDKLHFKMETLKSALTIVTPNCVFGCIDLKQAYFQFWSLLKANIGWVLLAWSVLCLYSSCKLFIFRAQCLYQDNETRFLISLEN